jgi:hypothetical protein
LILEREQYFLDLLSPVYNILKIAGSTLDSKRTDETILKISGKNNHFFGKVHSKITLEKLSEVKKGENNPIFGRKHLPETIIKNHEANSGENHPMFDKQHSLETKAKMSAVKGTNIYVYSSDKSTLINIFSSANKAAEYFSVSKATILSYCKNEKLFQDKWILCTISISIIVGS